MSTANDEQPQTNSSVEELESIAFEALDAAPRPVPSSCRWQGENDVGAVLGAHPNIAIRWDAELAERGQPCSVEGSADARRLDDYCDYHRLDVPARLRLFAQVCRAVHFAHQHAVIHGRLQPDHILVTTDGVPKVTGLGIARLAQGEVDRAARAGTDGVAPDTLPRTSELPLTFAYASPEQLTGESITTASDIYALGVVLYELLTGHSPYRLKTGTTSDVFQAVFEQAPERPSSAVTRKTAGSVDPPAGRKSKRRLSSDLDAIVLTALRKEPERRYRSAEHMAEDLDRYLDRRPVQARGGSAVYHCGKFIQRQPGWAAVGLLAVVALLAGAAAMIGGLVLAHRQQGRGEMSLNQARGIIDRISTRLSNERLLNQPGFHSTRMALLQDVQRFYTDLLKAHSSEVGTPPRIDRSSGSARQDQQLDRSRFRRRFALPSSRCALGKARTGRANESTLSREARRNPICSRYDTTVRHRTA